RRELRETGRVNYLPPPLWGRSPRSAAERRVGGRLSPTPPPGSLRFAPFADLPHKGGGKKKTHGPESIRPGVRLRKRSRPPGWGGRLGPGQHARRGRLRLHFLSERVEWRTRALPSESTFNSSLRTSPPTLLVSPPF